jgi:prenyltransferase beta subunit
MVLGLLVLAVFPHALVSAQGGTNDAAAQKAVAYIRTQQAADGTFAGFGAGSTADALYALAAMGINAADFKNNGASATEGLAKAAPEAAKDSGVAAKFVLAALLTGQNPRAVGGIDLVAVVQNGYDAAAERYGKDTTSAALALLALRAAGEHVQPASVTKLEQQQLPDGGWSFDGTAATGSDTNTTSLVLQALIASNGTQDVRTKALGYIRAQQNADGGFPYSQASQFGNASDANSTALSIQAILAAGESVANWTKEGKTPLDRLIAFQNPSGAFRYQDGTPDDNQLATYQAVPAIVGKTFPLQPIAVAQPAAPTATPEGALAPAPTVDPVTTTSPVPAPVAGGAAQLPDTGAPAPPVLALLTAALVVLALGIGLRRRSA